MDIHKVIDYLILQITYQLAIRACGVNVHMLRYTNLAVLSCPPSMYGLIYMKRFICSKHCIPLLSDDLEISEKITISRKFKETIVQPILKVRAPFFTLYNQCGWANNI